ncbi:FecR family protein [Chitinophaga arvensicola]|uniref:FecR protein n=1 Tax=Chitinophaga arvensicola TaxID=29529 RepID=A0A1I0NKD7_9BACT|nr:FecR family protein [Chitinophaga arvensicola]SEW01949.1 FecR protein [Chitinophaga arvensicola]
MNERAQYISQLVQKSLRESLETKEQLALGRWLGESAGNRDMYRQLQDEEMTAQELKKIFAYDKAALLEKILASPETMPVTQRRIIPIATRWWAAAAVFLLMGVGAWYFTQRPQPVTPQISKTNPSPDVDPGREGAILTLSDGSQLTIDSLGNGLVTTQNGVKVILQNGQLSYQDGNDKTDRDLVYNIMSTPRGRSFQLKLPDGTEVWLNALSSIRYPTAFSGKERKVEITGEVYFEIVPDASSPFYVNINNKATLQVLGTHFNVNAYENEKTMNTTLLEGAVRIQRNNGEAVQLKPGQQAQLSDKIKVVPVEDADKIMAWKNGLFNFEGAHLDQVMRQLERWYDIQVVYEKSVPDIQFFGEISRNLKLSEVIDALKMSDVHFRIEKDRKLIVLP